MTLFFIAVQDADDVGVSLAGGPTSTSSAPNLSWPPITPPIPQWLHQNVLRVLPTLDVLLFAIDVTSLEAVDMKYVKRELDIMLQVSKPYLNDKGLFADRMHPHKS